MSFQVGSLVVHTAHGVGRVTGIERKQFFNGEPRMYYVIAIKDGTIWAPVEESGTGKLREVVPSSDLPLYRDLIKSRPTPLDRDYRKRRLEISDMLKMGTFQTNCALVRDLTALSWQRPLSEVDASLLLKIRTNLCQEWAESAGISLDEAMTELDALLAEARQYHVKAATRTP